MIVLADENLDRRIARRLVDAGHEVLHISDLAPSITDDEVLAVAVRREALLITNDKDFGELVYTRGSLHTGVLLVRLGSMPFLAQAALVERTLREQGVALAGAFSVLTESRLRVRRHSPSSHRA